MSIKLDTKKKERKGNSRHIKMRFISDRKKKNLLKHEISLDFTLNDLKIKKYLEVAPFSKQN